MKLFIGRDIKNNESVYIDASKSRPILICGKRGSGKSYTLGVIAEEICSLERENVVPLIVDPMGIYWCICEPNSPQREALWEWGLSETSYGVSLLVPGAPEEHMGSEVVPEMKRRGVTFRSLKINASDLSPDLWCDLWNLNVNDIQGIGLYRAVLHLKKNKSFFTVKDIMEEIELDPKIKDVTKEALANKLEMVNEWNIFSKEYNPLEKLLDPASVNVLDLSTVGGGRQDFRNLIVSVLCKNIFSKRIKARKKEELGIRSEFPHVWLMIDEAQNFIPSGKTSLSKDILIRWVKEGRQPGLSFVAATQQPSALDNEILSQCDIIMSHKITMKDDVSALNRLSQDYMGSEFKTFIRKIQRVGEVVMVDDERERVSMVQIRPRRSRHGGGEIRI